MPSERTAEAAQILLALSNRAELYQMAIALKCACDQEYQLKDDLAGKLVQCPACGVSLRAEPAIRRLQVDPVFNHDRFLLRQKHLSLHEKYYVWNEAGQTLLVVERRVFLMQSTLAILAAALVAVFFLVPSIIVGLALQKTSPTLAVALAVVGVVLGLAAGPQSARRGRFSACWARSSPFYIGIESGFSCAIRALGWCWPFGPRTSLAADGSIRTLLTWRIWAASPAAFYWRWSSDGRRKSQWM